MSIFHISKKLNSTYIKCFVMICVLIILSVTQLIAGEGQDRETVINSDKKGLFFRTDMMTDCSKKMLSIPEMYEGDVSFIMAKTPPTIDFAMVKGMDPYFFPEDNPGLWSSWGIGTIGPDDCFYFALGSHHSRNGKVYIFKYNPDTRELRTVIDVGQMLGWHQGDWIDGKIHGELGIMPDGLLVAGTFFSRPPEEIADKKQYGGGKFFTYNIYTGKFTNLGVPFIGDSWAYHGLDTNRGIFLAIGHFYNFVSYDIHAKRTLYAGKLPAGLKWESCNALLDDDTGLWYAGESSTRHTTQEYHFVEYNPVFNKFRNLACTIPPNPVTGDKHMLRAYTQCRMPDDAFYCMDFSGTFFKFWPEKEQTELIGINWGPEGTYVTCIAANPGSRYLYYIISGHGRGYPWGAPVVQYDTKTAVKKVLAFLHPYYYDEYGFVNGGSYCFTLSKDGSKLFIIFNGAFREVLDKDTFGNPCLAVVHIPESEREE